MSLALTSPAAVAAAARDAAASARIRGLAAAIAVYATAVFHRSSLGVAGLDAVERYHISAGALSVFVLLQLGVYAGMQVPTGVLVDRFGPRRLLLTAAATSALAQFLFAVVPTYSGALGARALLGAGDALTFVSVLRFASLHFSPARFTMIVGLTGTVGALGSMGATVPLSAALDSVGWTTTFAVAGAASAVAVVVVARLVPDTYTPAPTRIGGVADSRPAWRRPADVRAAVGAVAGNVRAAWGTVGTRTGFWVHFATMSFTTMFGVLWGVPYLVAQGFSRGQASGMLTLSVVAGAAASLAVGAVFGRHRVARVPFALGIAAVTVAGWSALVFGFDGSPPHWLVAIAVAVTAVGGPASGIGFSLARDYSPVTVAGTAAGVVNVGGFSASILAAVGVGQALDAVGTQNVDAFRLAFAVALAVQAFGTVQALRWYRRLRAHVLDALERGEPVPVPTRRYRWDLPAGAARDRRTLRWRTARCSRRVRRAASGAHRSRASGPEGGDPVLADAGPLLRVVDPQPLAGSQAEHADLALVLVPVDGAGGLADLGERVDR